MKDVWQVNVLWYVGSKLVIPQIGDIHKILFRLAHKIVGPFQNREVIHGASRLLLLAEYLRDF